MQQNAAQSLNVRGQATKQATKPSDLSVTAGKPPPKDKSLASKDPLLKNAHGKIYNNDQQKAEESGPRAKELVQTVVLVLVPFIFYVSILFMEVMLFYAYPGLCQIVTFTVLLLVSSQYLVFKHCLKKAKWRRWIGLLSAVAVFAGCVVGLYIHYSSMIFWHKYTDMMKYTNVAASQNAQLFQDAGVLQFTSGTKVDTTRAVGFRNIRSAKTLCVAPLIDNQMGKDEPIVFFAIGENCCGWRATFMCGASGATSGVLMLEPNMLTSAAMTWAVDEAFDFRGFEKAVNLSKAVFSLSVQNNHRFLKWVQDPAQTIDSYHSHSMHLALVSCGIYLAFAFACVLRDVVAKTIRRKELASKLMANKSMLNDKS